MPSKRYARADRTRCVSCGACARECPRGAVEIWRGCFARIDPAVCVGCGRCREACPADCIALLQREAAS
ncbi:MAG: 4Fe-4S binding protein [Oscillibacter sp.]|nr:4Fe-4S binding protein [Oscillibacter sp.]